MAHHQHRDHQVSKLQTILRMVFSSDQPSLSTGQDVEVVDDGDEPPDHLNSHSIYIKSPPALPEKKESLLTRALLRSPDLPPADRARTVSYPVSNTSGHSTAELTSDGDLTSPADSNTSSPPHPSALHLTASVLEPRIASPPSDPNESKVEADLGRKRCISFVCARQPARPKEPEKKKTPPENAAVTAKPQQRKTALTFACPARQSEERPAYRRTSSYTTSRSSRSPPPSSRRPSQESSTKDATTPAEAKPATPSNKKPGAFHMAGLGDFQPSEETRFHEFASSLDEVDEWVAQSTEHQQKITLADCMKKEMAIRKLGEEAEAEAIAEEEEEDEEDKDEDDDDDDEQEEDDIDDTETVHDSFSDGGNESDNEAGFADSDDESDGNSEYGFWAPTTTTAATSADNMDLVRLAAERRNSNTSIDSLKHETSPVGSKGKSHRAINIPRAHTPDLPDSTDFVCGTLDEDRPLEAAYLSCIEERRRKKHVPVPQDIDPSFPTTDPEDNDDDDDFEEDEAEDEVALAAQIEEDLLRGRSKGNTKKTSRTSPRRLHSPPPRPHAHGHVSPKRAKSPAPPKTRNVMPAGLPSIEIPVPAATGVNITGPMQRPYYSRTKSLPRTPNPFFIDLEGSRLHSHQSPSVNSLEGAVSRSREPHTRGPIDIIQGLERKRQKRKEKFWRQHCRKAAAKEQSGRRATRGKGAERMKELGLEVAERFKAYGVGKDTQLMLSV